MNEDLDKIQTHAILLVPSLDSVPHGRVLRRKAMPPDMGLVARPRKVQTRYPQSSSTTVVIAGGSLGKWKGIGRCFSKEAGFVLVRCSSSSDVFSYCLKLAPCVLIVDQAFLEGVDAVDFGNMVDFGRSIQVLVSLESKDPATLENVLRMGCAGYLFGEPSRSTLRRSVLAVASGELWASRIVVS